MISNSIIQKKLYSPVITGVLLCDNYENDVVKPPAIMSGAIASPDYSGVYDELTKSYSPANIGVLFDNSQDSLGISSAYEADVLSNIYDVSSCESIGESSSVGFNLTGVGYCDNACSEKTSPVFTGVSIYENDSYLLQSLLCSTDFDTVVKDNNYMNYNVVDETNNVLLASSICPWFTKTAGSIDFEYSPDMSGNILKDVSTKFCEMNINNFSSVHEAVFYSGKPNFAYCKIPVRSNFNIQLWEQLLEDYHDKIVVEFLKYGWPLNYIKDTLPDPPTRRQNHLNQFSSFIDSYISKESDLGAIYGPFRKNPLCCHLTLSPLFTVPKGDSDRRVIVDCSHGNNLSINEGIPSDTFLNETFKLYYPRHEEFIALLLNHGRGCAIWKLDLSRAFRQLVLDPHDLHLQGYEWRGQIFIDNRLIFGMRSSPQACQRTTNAVSYMLWKSNIHTINYVDDFGGVSDNQNAEHDYNFVLELFQRLGLEVSKEKCLPPTKVLTFLGKEYNSIDMTVRIPEIKLQETHELLQRFEKKKHCTKRQLQQVIGKLAFISECVRSGRLFISRMLQTLRKYHFNHYRVHITDEFRQDIRWWLLFLHDYNGISIIPDVDWSSPDAIISSDACLKGIGGVNFTTFEYFHSDIPESLRDMHISVLEMYAIYIAIQFWTSSISNKRVQLFCDNQSCVEILNRGTGRDQEMLNLARQIWYLCASSNVQLRVSYIASVENRLSDLLSRWNLSEKNRSQFFIESKLYNSDFIEKEVFGHMFNDIINI